MDQQPVVKGQVLNMYCKKISKTFFIEHNFSMSRLDLPRVLNTQAAQEFHRVHELLPLAPLPSVRSGPNADRSGFVNAIIACAQGRQWVAALVSGPFGVAWRGEWKVLRRYTPGS